MYLFIHTFIEIVYTACYVSRKVVMARE